MTAINDPRLWSSVPEDLRLASSITTFKSLLKAHFYKKVSITGSSVLHFNLQYRCSLSITIFSHYFGISGFGVVYLHYTYWFNVFITSFQFITSNYNLK